MRRRVLAAIAAVMLAAIGAALIFNYARTADARAMASNEPKTVLVVAEEITKGTASERVVDFVTVRELPAVAVQQDAFTTIEGLDAVEGLVVNADLKPGEQLIAARFGHPETLTVSEVEVPTGMQQVSILLEPQRVIGGYLDAGAKVGIFVSLPEGGDAPAQTHLVMNQVLVTRVQGGLQPLPAAYAKEGAEEAALSDTQPTEDADAAAPAEMIIVTVAVNAADAERLVYGQEYGNVWLSLQRADANVDGTKVVTRENVYQ